ncbi:hypothetical protein C4D60_Mb10t10530 [Musa balbisiana]|uniref:Uncharacterized protein n=1 Tax=Musa balbisiana TaxID=52838 RepID=A0A4S8IW38_MUSBA|nr:hypothetical protein C4D60_Mb10t10530 [Musa balbisiana]
MVIAAGEDENGLVGATERLPSRLPRWFACINSTIRRACQLERPFFVKLHQGFRQCRPGNSTPMHFYDGHVISNEEESVNLLLNDRVS